VSVDVLGQLTEALDHHRAGRLPAAETLYRRVLAAAPDNIDALHLLGVLADQVGAHDAALDLIGRAIALAPGVADFHNNLGAILETSGRLEEAEASYRRAVALAPDVADVHSNLGNALKALGRLPAAVAAYERALALAPDHPQAHNNLGTALAAQGRVTDAIAHYRRALALEPAYAEAHSNLIFALDFAPGHTATDALAERRRWNDRHARPLHATHRPHANDRTPDRRLRIGYVSADFRRHSAAVAFAPLLLARDRDAFEVLCYAGVARPDERTTELRAAADVWRSTLGVSDEGLAEQIRADGVDILVDLSGHSAGHRLRVFARRPAPVQCTGFGHAGGTGLDAIDYLFADAVTAPPALHGAFSEAIVELPALIAYEPLVPSPPVSPAPARAAGAVTFGCFNRPWKITAETLAAWAEILRAVPGSHLLLKFGGLDDPAAQAPLRAALAARGVAGERVRFRGGTSAWDHLAAYADVDVALDPFPHGGGVTSLDGLWMGVPLVTLLGERVPGRMGASFLGALGLDTFVAKTVEEYVALAVRSAADVDGLADLRAALRGRLAASPLGDARAYCRAVEAAYRTMWRRWCEGAAPQLIRST
jgi:predicted O-linked N-acetylglucosamine transferase (SPINDLY family)